MTVGLEVLRLRAARRTCASADDDGEQGEGDAAAKRGPVRARRAAGALIYWLARSVDRHTPSRLKLKPAPAAADASDASAPAARQALRARLLARRKAFAASPDATGAGAALADALRSVIVELDPICLGLYCALPAEFNAVAALAADPRTAKLALALPYARREPPTLEYRRWDGGVLGVVDECGIGTCDGALVVPDVVVVPCVGFTAEGLRLGYGGGYYDRWLAAHPHVTSVGLAWSFAEVDASTFAARAHDVAAHARRDRARRALSVGSARAAGSGACVQPGEGGSRRRGLGLDPVAEARDLGPASVQRGDQQPVGERGGEPAGGAERLDQLAALQRLEDERQPRQGDALAGERGLHLLVGVVEIEPALRLQAGLALAVEPVAPADVGRASGCRPPRPGCARPGRLRSRGAARRRRGSSARGRG